MITLMNRICIADGLHLDVKGIVALDDNFISKVRRFYVTQIPKEN